MRPIRDRRPAPKPAPSDEQLRDERRARRTRAVEEPLDVRPRDDLPFPSLEVHNPLHQTRYRVLLPAYPERTGAMCTCTDFARRGIGTCKHLEAAWIWLEANPLPRGRSRGARPNRGVKGLWKAIDQRLRALPDPGHLRSTELRRAGEPLLIGNEER